MSRVRALGHVDVRVPGSSRSVVGLLSPTAAVEHGQLSMPKAASRESFQAPVGLTPCPGKQRAVTPFALGSRGPGFGPHVEPRRYGGREAA